LTQFFHFHKGKDIRFPEPINKTKEFVSQSIPNRFSGRIPTNCQNDSFTLTRMLYSELERGFDKKKRFSRIERKSFCQSFHASR